ncbi:MAG: VacJ family lipoprotein [Maricaulaceae bacterium]
MTLSGLRAVLATGAALISLSACASSNFDVRVQPDPWEGFNRRMFAIHNTLDGALLEPAAKGYRAAVPQKARNGVRHGIDNVRSPVILANDLMQRQWRRAGETTYRAMINTVFGFGGLIDVAGRQGVAQHSEDFGQTLARFGVPPGPYLFIPLLGPGNIRDGAGRVADGFVNPLTFITFNGDFAYRIGEFGVDGIDQRERAIEGLNSLEETSFDFYSALRQAYHQRRLFEIGNRNFDPATLPDFDDFDGEIPEEFRDLVGQGNGAGDEE